MSDFRLNSTFWDHPKTIRLSTKLGVEGVLALLRLWSFATEHRTKGRLTGLSKHEIERAARWAGTPGKLVKTLVETGWVDIDGEGTLLLHEWELHQTWVVGAKARSEKARKASLARYDRDAPAEARSNARSSPQSNAPGKACGNAPLPTLPLPSSPNLTEPPSSAPIPPSPLGMAGFGQLKPEEAGRLVGLAADIWTTAATAAGRVPENPVPDEAGLATMLCSDGEDAFRSMVKDFMSDSKIIKRTVATFLNPKVIDVRRQRYKERVDRGGS
ncbi:MAG: hypothetical protein M5U26_19615 [Planctomycetota bacterium]|nr:hypothetical protein [Planctomycetota bacterium]